MAGTEFLEKEAGITDKVILEIVRYHHGSDLGQAALPDSSPAYIACISDSIAAAADHREDVDGEGPEAFIPLDSIFNILNKNDKKLHYKPVILDDRSGPNMPVSEPVSYDEGFYNKVRTTIAAALKGAEALDDKCVNSLLCVLETHLSYLPSSASKSGKPDISLYDHVKMTAAYASCIFLYLEEQNCTDYKARLLNSADAFCKENAFRLVSIDLSGIQKFIYTIHSEGALRMLRARSFYLEILMEHMIDEILSAIGLSRANLLYSGGGHCYILVPNTEKAVHCIQNAEAEINSFFLSQFGVDLFAAVASTACCADDLENKSEGYAQIFYRLSDQLSAKKSSRYTPEQIRLLNRQKPGDSTRECRICKTSSRVDEEQICPFCKSLISLSGDILYKDYFSIYEGKEKDTVLLPFGKSLKAHTEKELRETLNTDPSFIRTYGKNKFYAEKSMATRLWVGDYTAAGTTTETYAKEAAGINRIAVLRADVDNLGTAFVSGFEGKYRTLSRTSTFSRQLSLFFKLYINHILENGEYHGLSGHQQGRRNVSIVYSGGDDLFIVGSWNDVIELAVDVRKKLETFSEGTLTISAGIGLYPGKYPLSVTASEVAELEDTAKAYSENGTILKNAVALFAEENTYPWKIFEEKVVGEKLRLLNEFLDRFDERGNAFLYRLLELLRNMEERINLARFAYLLARLEPKEGKDKIEAYRDFSRTLYGWAQDPADKQQLITAIYLYVYLNRIEEGRDEAAE